MKQISNMLKWTLFSSNRLKWYNMTKKCETSQKLVTADTSFLLPCLLPRVPLSWVWSPLLFSYLLFCLSGTDLLGCLLLMPPYTLVLSALCKTDLERLCTEFHISSQRSVVNLGNCLKDYLNLHWEMLYRNPRYNALFLWHCWLNQPCHPSPPSPTPSCCASTPPVSDRSSSPTLSYVSWHGIGGHDGDQDDNQPDEPFPQPPPVPIQLDQQPHFPSPHPLLEHPYDHHIPAPLNPPLNSEHGSIPPVAYPTNSCKYSDLYQISSHLNSPFSLLPYIPLSTLYPFFWTLWSPYLLDTMKSFIFGTMQPLFLTLQHLLRPHAPL